MLSAWFADNEAAGLPTFSPSLDVSENEGGYDVKVDLPGLQPNEINVQLSDNILTISGERKFEKTDDKDKGKKGARHIVELYHG